MPSSFVARSGLTLSRTPSHRPGRRLLGLLCGLLGLALASGVIGSLVRPAEKQTLAQASATGPFSYFPAQ